MNSITKKHSNKGAAINLSNNGVALDPFHARAANDAKPNDGAANDLFNDRAANDAQQNDGAAHNAKLIDGEA